MASKAEEQFYEGAEKLLEIWFASSTNDQTCNLRTIERRHWDTLLRTVQCEIISSVKDADMDSYLLSESSMFVTKNRFILKTCGTTTLLFAVKNLIHLVEVECGFDIVVDIFYSRKNFMCPGLQHFLHQSFEREVNHLDQMFKNGSAYVLGRMNRDYWYLYTLDTCGIEHPDQTLEILMLELCPKQMKIFTMESCANGREATERSGICDVIPGVKIDDHLYDPCGYSVNGILPGGYYITIHVTPESQCSYVSFESNVPQESYDDLIRKLLLIFKPGKFLLTIFANKNSVVNESHKHFEKLDIFEGYSRLHHQFCNMKNYRLTYTHFTHSFT